MSASATHNDYAHVLGLFANWDSIVWVDIAKKLVVSPAETHQVAFRDITESQPSAFPQKLLHVSFTVAAIGKRLSMLRTKNKYGLTFAVVIAIAHRWQ
jgi:hypothetical protein